MALFCNEEVLSVNQDALGIGAVCVHEERTRAMDRTEIKHKRIYAKPLEDGSTAIAMFNLGEQDEILSMPLNSKGSARDLWAKRELGAFTEKIAVNIPAHAARLLKLKSADHI